MPNAADGVRRAGGHVREVSRRAIVAEVLGEPEVQDLDHLRRRDLHVRGLQIAMDDSLVMRSLQRLGDLTGDRERLVHGKPRYGRRAVRSATVSASVFPSTSSRTRKRMPSTSSRP